MTSQANTNALGEQKSEQAALDTWNQQEAARQQAERLQQEQEAFQTRENAANRSAAAANTQATIAGANSRAASSAAAKAGPIAQQRPGGGFNFQDASGNAISARTYASLTGTSFNALLQQMSNAGDAGAAGYLKSGGKQYASALTWG